MSINLVIDAGNTQTKAALFEQNEIITSARSGNNDWAFVFEMTDKYNPSLAIISDVSGTTAALARVLRKSMELMYMNGETPVPLNMGYSSPKTLGPDRLAAAVYGKKMFPEDDVLVIQTGTCITYEFVSKAGNYSGGAISPGIDMRLKSMNTFTAKLPLVKKQEIDYLIGKTTKESILSGVINGCIAEIDGMIDQYSQNFRSLKIVAGGGDIFFFDKKLKNRIFATENLVLKGLNEILNFNNAKLKKY